MTTGRPPRPLRVLSALPEEDANRLERFLSSQMRADSLTMNRRTPQEVGAAMHPNRYEVLVIPTDAFAAFPPKLRRLCGEMVRLLVLTPGRSAEWKATADLPVTDEVALVVWASGDPPALVARLLALLIDGHPLAYAAALAWQETAPDGRSPAVREPAGDLWPPTSSSRLAPTPPVAASGSGSGPGNAIFNGPTKVGNVINNPTGPITINQRPDTDDTPITARDSAEQALLSRLTDFMRSYCSLEDLEAVAFDLGLETDDFAPSGRSKMARLLVLEMFRHNRLDELTAQLARTVPERATELRSND